MNPFNLDATQLLVWGLVAHLIADFLLQNDWMSRGKSARWWKEPSAEKMLKKSAPGFAHALVHFVALFFVFGTGAIPLAVAHYLIDLRTPVAWWSKLIRQTQPDTDDPLVGIKLYDENEAFLIDHAKGAWAKVHALEPRLGDEAMLPPREVKFNAGSHDTVFATLKHFNNPVDVGMMVRIWVDQVAHIACLAVAALLIR